MQRKRILIVDDEPGFALVLSMLLEKWGDYETCVENDANHAVDVARDFQPDMILLDIVMPGLDGGDVLNRLREDPRLGRVPVMFITALVSNFETGGTKVDTHRGERMMAKPVRREQVIESIEMTLAGAN